MPVHEKPHVPSQNTGCSLNLAKCEAEVVAHCQGSPAELWEVIGDLWKYLLSRFRVPFNKPSNLLQQ